MRVLEVAVKAIAACLGSPAPTKDADRNWGKMLESVSQELRNKSKNNSWKNKDKQFFADVYASLDAVRVAWRNPTMHVAGKYSDEEAEHIFATVRALLKKIASRLDENGLPLA